MPPDMGFNYEARDAAPSYKFNTSATSFAFNVHDFLSDMDILPISGHLPLFLATF